MREPSGDTKEHSSPWRFMFIVAGGITGAVVGWFWGEEQLSRFAAKVGISSRSLDADERGPMLIGFLIVGWIIGAVASNILIRIWRGIQLRMHDRHR